MSKKYTITAVVTMSVSHEYEIEAEFEAIRRLYSIKGVKDVEIEHYDNGEETNCDCLVCTSK
jgi:formyltetrahydrofolate synthetase